MTPIAHDATKQQQRIPSRLLEGTVLDPPLDAGGWLRVVVENQGTSISVPWEPRLDVDPEPGDAVALQESDQGNYWCVAWWPQSGQVPRTYVEAPLPQAISFTTGTRAARPAAGSLAIGSTYYATDNGITYRTDGAAWTAIDWSALRVTALPTSPAPEDGQEIIFVADATNGVLYHLKYNAGSASPFKWESVGSSWLGADVLTDETTASSTYTNLATVGPTVVAPLAGDYEVEFGCNDYNSTQGLVNNMSFAVGATAASDNDRTMFQQEGVAGTISSSTVSRNVTKTGVTAGASLQCKYRVSNAGTANFRYRWIRIRPIRVG